MKLRVIVTVDLTPEQVKYLEEAAKVSGHAYDGTTVVTKLIRRYLASKVENAVTYCHEQVDKKD